MIESTRRSEREPRALPIQLAEPWRRLAAAVTDVLLLIIAHVTVFGGMLLYVSEAPVSTPRLDLASAAFGWLYLWVSWAGWGATPGQAFWRLRVVTTSGERLGWWRATRRCLGYALACLPAKAGFLPILWHPWRQGWHDRLAGTVVVRVPFSGTWSLPEKTPPVRLEPWLPDWSVPRRRWWAVVGAYGLLAVAMTYPLVRHLGTSFIGGPVDSSLFVWGYWVFADAVGRGANLLHTSLIYYPRGVSLLYHTMDWWNCLLALPLQHWINGIATYNVLMWVSLVTCACSLYVVTASLTRDRGAAFVTSLAFGFSPYFFVGHAEHQNLLSAEFIPLFALFFYLTLVQPRLRYAVPAAVLLALTGLCDWYYFTFAVTAAVALAGGVYVTQGTKGRGRLGRQIAYGALALGLGVVLLSPLLLPMLGQRHSSGGMDVPRLTRERFKARLEDFVRPNTQGTVLRHWLAPPEEPERAVSVGLALLLLAGVGLWRGWRRTYPWLLVGLAGLVLACGPNLQILGARSFNAATLLPLGGPPGNGFDYPWSTRDLQTLALGTLVGPKEALTKTAIVRLPFVWLAKLVPPLRPLKCPVRFALLTMMCLSLYAALGLSWLVREKCGGCTGPRHRLILLAVLALVLAEYWVGPQPLYTPDIHPFYRWLGRDPAQYAIVEVPQLISFAGYQLDQTVHHKFLFVGHLARVPNQATAFYDGNELLQLLTPVPRLKPTDQGCELPLTEVSEAQQTEPQWRVACRRSLLELQGVGARYALVHTDSLDARSLRQTKRLFGETLKLPVFWEDSRLTVYDLRATKH
jgi:uncharacterized RDD family membrane protein YckC